jgi:hypothetical protein
MIGGGVFPLYLGIWTAILSGGGKFDHKVSKSSNAQGYAGGGGGGGGGGGVNSINWLAHNIAF